VDRHKVGLFAGYLAIAPAASAPTAAPNKTSAHPRPPGIERRQRV